MQPGLSSQSFISLLDLDTLDLFFVTCHVIHSSYTIHSGYIHTGTVWSASMDRHFFWSGVGVLICTPVLTKQANSGVGNPGRVR